MDLTGWVQEYWHNCYLNSSFTYAKANSCAGGLASAGADLTWEEYIS
jgi:hypothetical protein